MVPNVAKKGHSFKGAFAYYLHDKRQEGEARRDTAERVGWTETRNLATDNPETAKRIMIATAQQAEALKLAAGVTGGRKSNAHVYAYSLAWHPDEAGSIDRAEMMKAVEGSLKALVDKEGRTAEGLQAVIVAHVDEPQPHVHVILNRVMADGRMFNPSNDFDKLDSWALDYRRERGEHLKYCPKRAEKDDKRKEHPDPEARRAHVQEKFAQQTATQAVRQQDRARRGDRGTADDLAALGAAMKTRHAQEWKDLAAAYKEQRETVWKNRPAFKPIIAQHRADTRPEWSAFGKAQARERSAFYRRERTVLGVLENALDAVAARAARGEVDEKRLLRDIFRHTVNGGLREMALTDKQAREKAEFAAGMSARLDVKINAAKAAHAAKLAAVKGDYDKGRQDLRDRQQAERAKIREAWAQIYAERATRAASRGGLDRQRPQRDPAKASEAAQTRRERFQLSPDQVAAGVDRKHRLATANNPPSQEQKAVKRDFDKAREIAPRMNAPAPTERVRLSTPAPHPAPLGVSVPPPNKVHDVPKVDKAAEYAKATQARDGKPSPATSKRDFSKTAPPTAQPSNAAKRDFSRATPPAATPARASRDFASVERPKSQEVRPFKKPEKDRDRDR